MAAAHLPATPAKISAGIFPMLSLALALGLPVPSSAATLGAVNVLSSLGEPLRAEIEIFDLTAEESDDLEVSLASETEYENAGSHRSELMESLTLSVIQQGRRRLVQINTDKPLNTPIYGLLLELRANGESTMAEFALLPEPVAAPAEAVATAEQPATSQAISGPAEEPVPPLPIPPAASTENMADEALEIAGKGAENLALHEPDATNRQHLVQRGQNLTVIARQYSVSDSDLDKFIAATFNGNPDAFAQKNLHYLKSGAVLALPSDESVSQVDEKAARKTIIAQWESFKALTPPASMPSGKAGATQSNRTSSRKVANDAQAATHAYGDRLTLSSANTEGAGKTDEDIIAARKATDEANERIRLLEKNILDLKTTIQPGQPSASAGTQTSEAEEKEHSGWGILASPARDLIMQVATVLLLATLVVISVVRRNAK